MIQRKQLIDEGSGEIVRQADVRFTTLTNEGYKFPHNKAGVTMFGDIDFPAALSDADVGRITRLCRRYVVGETNLLGAINGRTIIPLTEDDIAKKAGYDSRKGDAFISRMIEHGIIKRIVIDGEDWFCVNPAYYMQRGKRLTLTLYIYFQDYLKNLLPRWVVNDFNRQASNL